MKTAPILEKRGNLVLVRFPDKEPCLTATTFGTEDDCLPAPLKFMPKSAVRPYVGAGINYTIYYSESASSFVDSALGATDVSLSSSFGWAIRARPMASICCSPPLRNPPRRFVNLVRAGKMVNT